MPVSAYLKATFFVVAAAVALFAAAGTVAIPGFWAHLAIFAVVMIVSFTARSGPRGPYAFVPHPGYTAGILIIVASGPALGSWLAAALVVIFSLPFLLHRAITEDRILQ